MSRLIFIIVIIAVVYFLFKSYRRQQQPPKQTDATTATQDMVSCAFCGVHLPKSESYLVSGKFYCCVAHSRGQKE